MSLELCFLVKICAVNFYSKFFVCEFFVTFLCDLMIFARVFILFFGATSTYTHRICQCSAFMLNNVTESANADHPCVTLLQNLFRCVLNATLWLSALSINGLTIDASWPRRL